MVLATETIVRGIYDRPVRMSATNDSVATLYRAPRWTGRLKLMTAGVAFMAIVLFIRYVRNISADDAALTFWSFLRSIYRTIELSDGWNGRIISTQVYFSEQIAYRARVAASDDRLCRRARRCDGCTCNVHLEHPPPRVPSVQRLRRRGDGAEELR